jgi:hypothetical protein
MENQIDGRAGSGLYYKHILIVSDSSRVVSKWCEVLVNDAPNCGIMFSIKIDDTS